MGKTGRESLQNRILSRSAEDVPLQDAREAEKYIQFHTLEQCRGASSGTATFYKWVSKVESKNIRTKMDIRLFDIR